MPPSLQTIQGPPCFWAALHWLMYSAKDITYMYNVIWMALDVFCITLVALWPTILLLCATYFAYSSCWEPKTFFLASFWTLSINIITLSFSFITKKYIYTTTFCFFKTRIGHFTDGPVCLPTYIRRMMGSFGTEKLHQVRSKLFKYNRWKVHRHKFWSKGRSLNYYCNPLPHAYRKLDNS